MDQSSRIALLTDTPPRLHLAEEGFVSHVTQEGRPGLGPPNEQLFQSGETNAEPINPADSQGMGRAPGWRWAHYPKVQQFNADRLCNVAFLDGQYAPAALSHTGTDSGRQMRQAIWPEGYENYRQQPRQKHVWPHVAIVNQDAIPSFSQQLPPITDPDSTGW